MIVYHQLLATLLKSSRPEDLETANMLIKSTIKEVRSCGGETAVRLNLKLLLMCSYFWGFLGTRESRESVKAGVYSEGGGEQHQGTQRTTGAAQRHWSHVRAER